MVDDHERILQAVVRRDPEGAGQAMIDHVEGIIRTWKNTGRTKNSPVTGNDKEKEGCVFDYGRSLSGWNVEDQYLCG